MSSEAQETNECGICLDALTDPIMLPCGHSFCAKCLDDWKSKYGGLIKGEADLHKKCPLCRENIPPSREMVIQLNTIQEAKTACEKRGDYSSTKYKMITKMLKNVKAEIGEWDGKTVLAEGNSCESVELPRYVAQAATKGNIGQVVRWLNQGQERINAECLSGANMTLLYCAVILGHCNLSSILLQRGANVNIKDPGGTTPVDHSVHKPGGIDIDLTLLLLQWGAEFGEGQGHYIQHTLPDKGYTNVSILLKSEFGGRRCEIVKFDSDLNGKTCIVDGYLPAVDQYKVTMDFTDNQVAISPEHLKRRDRTPDDPGYYIEHKNGRTIRRNFESNEQCQAHVASLKNMGELPAAANTEAEARAERAAADFLAELDLEEPPAKKGAKDKPGKDDGKRKGKKKKKKGKK